jgi:PAS domain S-box-containing protein
MSAGSGGAAEGERRFELLVASIKEYAIFLLDASGHIVTWNAGAQFIKGYLPEEVIGKHISMFYTPEDRAAGRPQALLAAARKEGRVEDEGWRVKKDGTRFWADVVITAIVADGVFRGFIKVTRDLTARRQAEEELRQSEARLRLMVASVRDYALYMIDPAGHVTTWNPGAQRIKGYGEEEILGQPISRFFTPEDVAGDRPTRELEVALREGRFEEEGWRVRKDGSRFWANVVLTPIRDGADRLLGFVKITRDLTDRRKTEEERLRLVQAREAIRLRDEFLSIASHELKTPLAALLLLLANMRKRMAALDQHLANSFERAIRIGTRLGQLVDALLDVSRIAAGELSLNVEPFDLCDSAREVTDRMRESAAAAQCELSFEVAGPVEGRWDRLRIEQVLMNLLSNAIKYAAGRPICVSVAREGETAQLRVSDGGPGIPESQLPRIFERFERAVSARHYGGMGLGLYVARQIAEAHGGSIGAANLERGGACFTVSLPVGPGRPADHRSRMSGEF